MEMIVNGDDIYTAGFVSLWESGLVEPNSKVKSREMGKQVFADISCAIKSPSPSPSPSSLL